MKMSKTDEKENTLNKMFIKTTRIENKKCAYAVYTSAIFKSKNK